MSLKLKMTLFDNPRIAPLKDGTVRPKKIDLEIVTVKRGGSLLFYRCLANGLEFDASEMSISDTLITKERNETLGKGRWDWIPIPVFLSRGYHFLDLYINTSSGIEHLGNLRGKRIGVPDYPMTAALWFRIMLKELYGIEAWDNIWFNGRTKELSHAGAVGLHLKGYEVGNGITLHWLTVEETLDVMLDHKELDAIFPPDMSDGITVGNATVIDRYGGTPMKDNPRIRKLFNDKGKGIIYEFFQRTGYHQPNHHIVIKNSILKEHPWVAMSLYKAFEQAKEVAYERAQKSQSRSTFLYFEGSQWEEQTEIFGEDPYPLGLRMMSKTIERAIQGSVEQGLIKKPIRLEDLYFYTTLNT